jgi:hypothetical protein
LILFPPCLILPPPQFWQPFREQLRSDSAGLPAAGHRLGSSGYPRLDSGGGRLLDAFAGWRQFLPLVPWNGADPEPGNAVRPRTDLGLLSGRRPLYSLRKKDARANAHAWVLQIARSATMKLAPNKPERGGTPLHRDCGSIKMID